MSVYLRTAAIALFTLLIFSSKSGYAASQLEWCVDHIPMRHAFTEQGLKGPTVDFMQTVASRAGFTLKHSSDTPFQRCLKLMQSGRTDLMMAVVKSPEREAYMHFIPVYKGRSESLFMNTELASQISDKKAIQGLRLAKVRSYVMNTPDWSWLAENNNVTEVDSVDDGLALVFHDHVDVLISPHFSTLVRLNHNPRLNKRLVASNVKLRDSDNTFVYLAFSKYSDVSPTLRDKTHQIIRAMRETNEVDQILFDSLKTLNKVKSQQ